MAIRLLVKQMDPEMRPYVEGLTTWFRHEMAWLFSTGANVYGRGSSSYLMGFPLWGQDYVTRFDEVFVASAFCGENMRTLARRVTLVLYVPPSDVDWSTDYGRQLQQRGVAVVVRTIPEELVAFASEKQQHRYPLLGCVQNLLVQAAGRWGMDLHPTLPDTLVQDGYFRNLDRLGRGHDAVVQNSLSVDAARIAPALTSERGSDGSLSLSDVRVGDLALEFTHPQMRCGLMNGAVDYPGHHFMYWRGEDFGHIAYINAQPTFMSADLCLSSRVSLWSTLDAQVPRFMRNARTYVPTAGDGLAYLEVSGANKEAIDRRVALDEFVAMAWDVVDFDDSYMPWLRVPYRFAASPTEDCEDSDDILSLHSLLADAVEAGRLRGMARIVEPRLPQDVLREARRVMTHVPGPAVAPPT